MLFDKSSVVKSRVVSIKKKNVRYYMSLPWTYTVEIDKDQRKRKIYIVSSNELPGIKTDARTLKRAMKNIREALEAAIELYKELGKEIPEPARNV